MNTYRIYSPATSEPITLLVFGPYSDGFDVEIHKGHIAAADRGADTYVSTHTIARDTHVIADMFDTLAA